MKVFQQRGEVIQHVIFKDLLYLCLKHYVTLVVCSYLPISLQYSPDFTSLIFVRLEWIIYIFACILTLTKHVKMWILEEEKSRLSLITC